MNAIDEDREWLERVYPQNIKVVYSIKELHDAVRSEDRNTVFGIPYHVFEEPKHAGMSSQEVRTDMMNKFRAIKQSIGFSTRLLVLMSFERYNDYMKVTR